MQSRFYGSSNNWRSSLTTISPVGTSWSSNRFVIGPLEPWSFFISANRISVLPKKSGVWRRCGWGGAEMNVKKGQIKTFISEEQVTWKKCTDRPVRTGLVQTQWHRGRPVPGLLWKTDNWNSTLDSAYPSKREHNEKSNKMTENLKGNCKLKQVF